MNLIDILFRAGKEAGSKVFMAEQKKKMTYTKTCSEVIRFASGLANIGIKKGDRVAILLNNCMEFVIAYFSIIYSGAEAVPINTFLRYEEVVYILKDCGAKCLITSPDFKGIISQLGGLPELKNYISTGEIPVKYIPYQDIFSDLKKEPPEIKDSDTAVIIYTSGTTGYPKGALLTHSNLISNIDASTRAIKVLNSDRFILFLPMFHALTFTVCVLLPIYRLNFIRIMKSVLPFSNIIKSLVFDRISIFVAIPQVFNVLSMRKIPRIAMWLLNVRVCVSGAAPLPGEVLIRFEKKFGIPLLEGYGLSEASPVVSVNPLDAERKPGSVGLALPGVVASIMDENGVKLKTGEEGEIAVSGPNVMKGYLNRPDDTASTIKDGWLYTGDIGKIDSDGYIYILDRKKDLIIVNGMNLYPREVEDVLYKHPAVEDAAVVGIKDETHGEIPIGIIKLKDGRTSSDIEIRQFCRKHLANFKVPHRFEFWQELPRTGTGKILKREIKRILNEKK
jgi:long-chain acyl-CoA synthetase